MLILALSLLSLFGGYVGTAQAVPWHFYGMAAYEGHFLEDHAQEYAWKDFDRSGARIIRANALWKVIDDEPPYYNWTNNQAWVTTYDVAFARAASHNLSVLPVLVGRRDATNESQFYKPGEAGWQEWQQFVWTFVQRYGRNGHFWKAHPELPYHPVIFWEVWNEPNLARNNPGGTTVQPAAYAQFLISTANTIRSAQNEIRKQGEAVDTAVIHGGLYQNTTWEPWNFFNTAKSVPGYWGAFDGLGLHPYALNGNFNQRVSQVKSNILNTRAALADHGGAFKSIWITELGWPIAGKYSNGTPVAQVSEADQAKLLTATFKWIKENWAANNIQHLAWYLYADVLVGQETWDYFAGLKNATGAYRQSWYAYQMETGAARWPNVWATNLLGEHNYDEPAISKRGTAWDHPQLDLFTRSHNDNLFHRYYTGSQWLGWENWGGNIASGPSSVSWSSSRIDIAARLANNEIGHWYWLGSNWGYETFAVQTNSMPGLSTWGVNRLDVFYRGLNNVLNHRAFSGSQWFPWEALVGPTIVSAPDAVSWGSNRIDVVARLADNTVGHWYWHGSGWGYDNLGGSTMSKPTISSSAPNQLDVFIRGSNDTLMNRTWNGAFWSQWEAIPGPALSSGPDAVSRGLGNIDVVGRRASDNTVVHWFR